MYPQESDTMQILHFGEGHVLELISTGAALPEVLDKICTALDVQMGNVVSVVLFLDDDEHFTHTIAQYAAECGLTVFSCTAILSPSDELLGTLETYSYLRRSPTENETTLIERATRLAALAIQLYDHAPDSESPSSPWKGHAWGEDLAKSPRPRTESLGRWRIRVERNAFKVGANTED